MADNSVTKICNTALATLGKEAIISLDDNSSIAKTCKLLYGQIIEEMQSDFDYSFCKFRKQLAQSSETPVFGFDYAYQLPTNPKCLKLTNVKSSSNVRPYYKIEDNKLLTDETDVYVQYVGLVDDAAKFTANFRKAVSLKMAAMLVVPTAGVKYAQLRRELLDEADKAERAAQGIDASNSYDDNPGNDYWTTAGTE